MSILRIDSKHDDAIDVAASVLKRGGLVVLPTDTVYGLVCLASDKVARARIYSVKGRVHDKPLINFISDAAALKQLISAGKELFERLSEQFWPGPLTIVAQLNTSAFGIPLGGWLGSRIPDHPLILKLIKDCGGALASTSANLSGSPAVRNSSELDSKFLSAVVSSGEVLLIEGSCGCAFSAEKTKWSEASSMRPTAFYDNGPSRPNAKNGESTMKICESTVVKIHSDNIEILREGAIPSARIRELFVK